MDFVSEYNTYSKINLGCVLGDQIHVLKIMHGSGGSHNIIIKAAYRTSSTQTLIIKVFPLELYHNMKIKPNFNDLEIKFYQFFTHKYLLKNRTPHLVGIYSYKHCNNLENFINKKLLKQKCPDLEDQLVKKKPFRSESDNYLCDVLLRKEMKLIMNDFDMALIEYCDGGISEYLYGHLSEDEMQMDEFISGLNKIVFEIIFTLAIIKLDYPGFLHGDFFLRNILLKYVKSGKMNYVAYHFKNKIFYVNATGFMTKINDFGMTVIANKIEPNVFDPQLDPRLMFNGDNYDPFSKKTDLYNFFVDLYRTINDLQSGLEISKKKLKPVYRYISRFFNTKAIDKIPNKEILYEIWHINGISALTSTLKTPMEYLMGDYFSEFEILESGGKVILHYNN